jgi:hypothetical protein
MKRQLPLAAVLIFAVASLCYGQCGNDSMAKSGSAASRRGSLEQTLADRETTLWQAWKDKNAAPFQQALSSDSLLVSDTGVAGKAQAIKEITSPACTVESFSLSDFKLTMFDRDAALLTYRATQNGKCGDTMLPANVFASSLWLKRGNKWLAVFHQESPAAQQSMAPTQE